MDVNDMIDYFEIKLDDLANQDQGGTKSFRVNAQLST